MLINFFYVPCINGICVLICELTYIFQVSDDEVAFLTQRDPQDEENVLSLWYEGLKLLIVTDGEKGCRYFTKVNYLLIIFYFIFNIYIL